MKILVGFIFAILIYLGFSFFNVTTDISKWSEEGRFMCGALMLIVILGGGMLEYLEGNSK